MEPVQVVDACRHLAAALDDFEAAVASRLQVNRNDLRALNLLESGPVSHPASDGGSIDLDTYRRGTDGGWTPSGSGGGAGDSGTSWSPHMVVTYGRGRTAPGKRVHVDYRGQFRGGRRERWWLFAARSLDDRTVPRSRSNEQQPQLVRS